LQRNNSRTRNYHTYYKGKRRYDYDHSISQDLTIRFTAFQDTIRPYVPKTLRKRLFDAVHGLAHASARTTKHQIQKNFVWPRMGKNISEWARTCLACQRSKIHRHLKLISEQMDIPDERFRQVHLDLIGPLPISKGFRYCLTMIDRYSRWPEATPLANITAETVAKVFYATWISRYGVLTTVTTDQGTQFEADLFKTLTNLLGCTRTRTSPYHPASWRDGTGH